MKTDGRAHYFIVHDLRRQQGDNLNNGLARRQGLEDVGVGVENSGNRLQVDQTGGTQVLKQIVRKFKQFPFCVNIMIVKLLYGVNVLVIIT